MANLQPPFPVFWLVERDQPRYWLWTLRYLDSLGLCRVKASLCLDTSPLDRSDFLQLIHVAFAAARRLHAWHCGSLARMEPRVGI